MGISIDDTERGQAAKGEMKPRRCTSLDLLSIILQTPREPSNKHAPPLRYSLNPVTSYTLARTRGATAFAS